MKVLERYQIELAKKVVLKDLLKLKDIEYVGGVDQAFLEDKVISACALFSFPDLTFVRSSVDLDTAKFPYIPGFLMFREGDPAVKVIKKTIKEKNVVVLVDGSGIAHPRRCGLATYIAIKTKIPTVGITKRRLFGRFEPPKRTMEAKPIYDDSEIIGYALKTCKGCKPIFISPGNYLTPETALEIVKLCLRGHKLPEPIRVAHNLANEYKKLLIS